MKYLKTVLRENWVLASLVFLSLGVLAGCEYCGPVLLAEMVAITLYGAAKVTHEFVKLVDEALQIQPITGEL